MSTARPISNVSFRVETDQGKRLHTKGSRNFDIRADSKFQISRKAPIMILIWGVQEGHANLLTEHRKKRHLTLIYLTFTVQNILFYLLC